MAKEKQEEKEQKTGKAETKEPKQRKQEKAKDQHIVRFADTNIEASRAVQNSITAIRGVGTMFANAVTRQTGLYGKKFADLTEDELNRLEQAITHPGKSNIPLWMHNRRRDPMKGVNQHLTAGALDFTQKMDINEMKKMKSYKGVRHSRGLPVRGQRTRSSFRKGSAVGVKRKRAAQGSSGKK